MISLDTNAGTLAVRYKDAPTLVASTITRVMNRIGQKLNADLVTHQLRGGSIDYRTGNLSRSAFYRLEVVGSDEIRLRVGTAMEKAAYARIQDQGGVVRPRNGTYLAIPLDAARTGNGVGRFTARQLFDRPESFGYVDAFVHNGVIFGVQSRPKGKSGIGTVIPLFALKRSITIQPHHFIANTLRDNLSMIKDELGLGLGDIGKGLSE